MTPAEREVLLKYINASPGLLSVLYDLDYMPEQVVGRPADEEMMYRIAAIWHRAEDEEREACAKVAERCFCGQDMYDGCRASGPNGVAKAIRGRAERMART